MPSKIPQSYACPKFPSLSPRENTKPKAQLKHLETQITTWLITAKESEKQKDTLDQSNRDP
jgi:hypothetical protein